MRDDVELHDSRVVLGRADGVLVLRLAPAYVHHWTRGPGGWRGEGRRHAAEIRIAGGSATPMPGEGPFQIAGGWLQVGDRRFDNLIPAALDVRAPVRGRLDLVNAPPLEVAGAGVVVRLTGDAQFVEALPPEWAPGADRG